MVDHKVLFITKEAKCMRLEKCQFSSKQVMHFHIAMRTSSISSMLTVNTHD